MTAEPEPQLLAAVDAALERRRDLLARLHAEGTDCYRVFHGIAEGAPGLCIDRYGPLLLLQTFRAPMPAGTVEDVARHVGRQIGCEFQFAHNHRGSAADAGAGVDGSEEPVRCSEGGVRYLVQARHRGQDPWLFLDLRAGRAAVRELARGRTVLNLFAYTCGAGVAAATGGAAHVLNVDFAASALAVGRRNAALNGIADDRFATLQSDCIPVLRQLARLPVQRRGGRRAYAAIAPQQFDLVFLDPPRWSVGPFGAVDVVRDYSSLWKPCLLTLAEGGIAIATNHVAEVDVQEWCLGLQRAAAKAGRPLASLELLEPGADFPSFDGRPPLKVAVCRV